MTLVCSELSSQVRDVHQALKQCWFEPRPPLLLLLPGLWGSLGASSSASCLSALVPSSACR